MNKLFTKIVIAAAVLTVGFFGLQHYLQYNLKQQLDSAIRTAKPFAHIEYGAFSLKLPNRLQLDDLRVIPASPAIGNFSISTIKLTVTDSDRLLLIKQLLNFTQQRAPDQLDIDIKDLTLSPVEFTQYTQALEQLNQHLSRHMTLMCGDTQFIGPKQLQAIGFDPMHLDVHFGYQFDRWAQTLVINTDTDIQQGSATRMQFKLRNIAALDKSAAQQVLNPAIDKITIHYEDHGYTNKVNHYCAQQSRLTLAEYIDREINRPNQDYAHMWGVIPGTELKKAYNRFMRDPQNMTLTIAPDQGFNWASLAQTPPEQWPGQVNMSLSVNDEPVPSLSFQLANMEQLVEAATPVKKVATTPEEARKKRAELLTQATKPVFYTVTKNSIANYQGKYLRISTDNDRTHEGTLVSANGHSVVLRQQKFGGHFDINVALSGIKKVEVSR